MRCLHAIAAAAVFWLLCAKSEQFPNELSLETRVASLETRLLIDSVNNMKQVNDLKSMIKNMKGAGNESPGGGVTVDVENRLSVMETKINSFRDSVLKTEDALMKGLSKEKVEVDKLKAELKKILGNQEDDIEDLQGRLDAFVDKYNEEKVSNTRELNAQLLEAVNKLNETFTEFSKDLMKEKEIVVKESQIVKAECQAGWFQRRDRCYLYVKDEKKPWHLAGIECHNRGGKLAEPVTAEIFGEIIDKMGNGVWIGGTDEEKEGEWVWSGINEKITYVKWISGQPNSSGGDQDCLEIHGNGWNDEGCMIENDYLCEKKMHVEKIF